MTTRRAFLQATTLGIASRAFSADAHEQSSNAGQASPGTPPAIIDFHAHWVGPTVSELLSKRSSPRLPEGRIWFDMDARLQQMEQAGVQRQVLSYIGPAFDGVLAPAEARPFWRAQNDDTAALVRKYPKRFAGLATLPTANVAWAADELERAHQELGLLGATLPLDAFTSLSGARALAPIFAVAQKHRSHIYVHRGAASPEIPGQYPENGITNEYFGLSKSDGPDFRAPSRGGDNQSARAHLITASHLATGVITLALTDFLDAYPDVTVQMTMMGGTFSSVAEWIQRIAEESGQPIPAKRFRSIYLDCGARGRYPRGVTLGARVFGVDRILFGTDLGPVTAIMPTIATVQEATLTREEKNQIFVDNARRLLAAKGVT